MNYDLQTKIEVLDACADKRDQDVADEYGMSRRTIINWKKQEGELRDEWRSRQVQSKALELRDELGVVAEYEKMYLDKLDDLGDLESRKKVFVGALEKVMWDHLSALDGELDVKPDVRVRMLKDLNEIREKLSGEPSVIMEYRNKFQMNVMMVVKEMIPERAEEFLNRIKMVEE